MRSADSHYQHLRRGFNWLGSATIIAKLIDFATILLVLLFLTKQQVGLASLVVSLGIVVESMNGLGTREALVQTRAVSRLQLDSVFWFVMGAALAVAGLILAAAPLIESAYGFAGMAAYFIAVAAKQPIVGAALLPLAMMNRDLQFERIAVVNVCATFAAALTRLGLAVAGAGAWALVVGFSAHGVYVLIGAQLAKPFLPRPRFQMRAIAQLVRFGIGAAASNALQQLFKNIDFLLIGWFYGPAQLAIYRVAFDIAMEPAVAVGTLVERTALPVFARVAAVKEQLGQAFIWSLGRVAVLVAPLMTALMLAADPLTALLHDRAGQSYAAAALPLKLLAGAALLRVSLQLLYPMMLGAGRPRDAVRLSATTLLLLSAGILGASFSFSAHTGILAVSTVWLALYPLLLAWGARYLWRNWNLRVAELARVFILPAAAAGSLVAIVAMARLLPDANNPKIRLGVVLVAAALTYGGLFLHARLRPYEAV